MSMPQSLGYASIAAMPAVAGLHTLLFPLIGFAAFGSSRYLVVAADSATAAILSGGIAGLPAMGLASYQTQVGIVALLTAVFLLLARLLQLGFLADFLSQTVLTGFLTGVGVQVGIGALSSMTGIPVDTRRSILQLAEVGQRVSDLQPATLLLAMLAIAIIVAGNMLLPRFPAPLVAVIASIALGATGFCAAHGIATIGPIAGGLPHFAVPMAPWHEIEPLIPIAASCFVVILTQSAATARSYALNHQQHLNENDDLIGLAAANGLAALTGTFVVNGSPTQTTVAETSGARSQLAHLTAAAVVGAVLLWFTQPLEYLPRCVLGAIVFVVAMRLMKFGELRAMRRESPGEFWLAIVTAAVVVAAGVEEGIVLAMTMSLLRIVQHTYRPHTAVLIEGDRGVWRPEPVAPGIATEAGLVVYRFGAPLFYANAPRFTDEVRGLVNSATKPLRWLVVDAGAITRIDFSAARALRILQSELESRDVQLVWAHVEPTLAADLARHQLNPRCFDKLHDALAAWREQ